MFECIKLCHLFIIFLRLKFDLAQLNINLTKAVQFKSLKSEKLLKTYSKMAVNSVKLLNFNEEVEPPKIGTLFLDIWAVKDFVPYNPDELLPQLEVGDEIWLKLETQGYSHVLLYIGNGEVVHVANVEKPGLIGKTLIRRDYLNDVAEGHLVGFRKTPDLTDEMRKQIRKRGLNDVGKLYPYYLTTENCEHQVKYWISGIRDYSWTVSTQVSIRH